MEFRYGVVNRWQVMISKLVVNQGCHTSDQCSRYRFFRTIEVLVIVVKPKY